MSINFGKDTENFIIKCVALICAVLFYHANRGGEISHNFIDFRDMLNGKY